ncbi:hypothetical protein FRC06_011422 [Ceratobasidium sp. 370]|nr:hypothetical protein FRC06_011422 [Ceratobasidium sp. 370]
MHIPFRATAVGISFTAVLAAPSAFSFRPDKSISDTDSIGCQYTSKISCATYDVPFNHQNVSEPSRTFKLAVYRYPAPTHSNKLGTLFLNPGGPGNTRGLDLLNQFGDKIQMITGERYDLVTWEPRGGILSTPHAVCFESDRKEKKFWRDSVLHPGIEAPADLTSPKDRDAFFAKVAEADKVLQGLGAECLLQSPNVLQYVGTAATVRDMVALHDKLEGPEKPLNFWGFSYGTIIGMYFMNMFPERVGRVVLDGVVDPEYWADKPAHESWSITATSIDETLRGFASACAAKPSACAFSEPGDTTDKLIGKIRDLFDRKEYIQKNLNDPESWKLLAVNLERDYYKVTLPEVTPIPEIRLQHDRYDFPSPPNSYRHAPARDYALQAVTCADAMDSGDVTTRTIFEELARVATEVAPICKFLNDF